MTTWEAAREALEREGVGESGEEAAALAADSAPRILARVLSNTAPVAVAVGASTAAADPPVAFCAPPQTLTSADRAEREADVEALAGVAPQSRLIWEDVASAAAADCSEEDVEAPGGEAVGGKSAREAEEARYVAVLAACCPIGLHKAEVAAEEVGEEMEEEEKEEEDDPAVVFAIILLATVAARSAA
jgi:hypothetical protein